MLGPADGKGVIGVLANVLTAVDGCGVNGRKRN